VPSRTPSRAVDITVASDAPEPSTDASVPPPQAAALPAVPVTTKSEGASDGVGGSHESVWDGSTEAAEGSDASAVGGDDAAPAIEGSDGDEVRGRVVSSSITSFRTVVERKKPVTYYSLTSDVVPEHDGQSSRARA
jgi:hypothetical protein